MLKSLFALFTVVCADADLHLLQMAATRQNPQLTDEELENDEPVVDGPPLNDEELENGNDGSPDDPPLVDEPENEPGQLADIFDLDLIDQTVLEDHIALLELDLDDEGEAEVGDAQLPGLNGNGVYPSQRPKLKRGDIRGFLPGVGSMSKCQCEGEKRKNIGVASVIYWHDGKRCVFLKNSVDFNNRISDRRFSASQKLVCVKQMQWCQVPKTCDGKRGFDHARCTKIMAAAGYTWGSWRNKKKCFQTVSTNPKFYDWEKAKDYCLKGNSYCNGIAKLTVKKGRNYVNEYTFCKVYGSRYQFVVGNLPATWPYGGVLEVRRQPRVEMPEGSC